MNSHSRRQYLATIAAAHSADLRHYRAIMAQYAEYPYEGCGTQLTRALWLEKTGQLEERHMTDVRRYMKLRGITARQLADECNESLAVVKKVSAGCYHGAAAERVHLHIQKHPVEPSHEGTRAVDAQIDRAAAGETLRWLQGVIDSGRVKAIEIRMEVNA